MFELQEYSLGVLLCFTINGSRDQVIAMTADRKSLSELLGKQYTSDFAIGSKIYVDEKEYTIDKLLCYSASAFDEASEDTNPLYYGRKCNFSSVLYFNVKIT